MNSSGGETPLRILHVTRQFAPGVGGLENFVEQLARRQLQNGHRVAICTLNRIFDGPDQEPLATREDQNGLEIRRIGFWGSRRYPIAPGVLKHMRDADIVHVHGVDFFCDFLAATKLLHRKPLILTTHGGFFHTGFARRLKHAYFHLVTRLSLTRYAAVATCSSSDTERFKPVRKRGLVEIANAVDIDKFAGLADQTSNGIIYFGRWAPNKELPRLIDWFSGLYEREPSWKLTIAGKPMGVSCEALTTRIEAAGLLGAIRLCPSPSDEGLAELIASNSVYACASSYEGFGLAAVEAASGGLYPVLSEIPPFAETTERLGFGQLVAFEKPETYPESYRRLSGDLEEFRREWSKSRISAAVSSYGWDGATAQYGHLYDAALGRASRRIGPVRIDVLTEEAALESICRAIAQRIGAMFTFANAHTVNVAALDPSMRHALSRATILNDGVGADVASRLLFGSSFPENLNGTDFVPRLLTRLPAGTSVFLLGSNQANVAAAAEAIAKAYPNIRVADYHCGFFAQSEEEGINERIKGSGADLVLIGMGQPRQEIWADRNLEALGIVALCVGAFLDFTAGAVPRAPAAWRGLRLEWAFRLLQEPRRLAGRYLKGNLVFLGRLLRQYLEGSRV